MTQKMNSIFVEYMLNNMTREEAIEKIATAITWRDDIIKKLQEKPAEEWEDRMGGQFTKQEIEDAKGGW